MYHSCSNHSILKFIIVSFLFMRNELLIDFTYSDIPDACLLNCSFHIAVMSVKFMTSTHFLYSSEKKKRNFIKIILLALLF